MIFASRKPSTRLLLLLASLGLLLLGTAACSADEDEPSATKLGPVVGNEAPPFELTSMSNEAFELYELRGSGVIINFWSTWCIPCVRELPLLEKVARERADDGLTIIAVNMGETQEEVHEFLTDIDLSFSIILDLQGVVANLYGVPGLPMSFFIDADGIIRYRRIGELKEDHIATGLERIL